LSNHYTKEETRNLIEADLAYYATKTYVDQKIAEAELGGEDVDLSGYYTKEETDTAISDAVGAVEVPSLDGYATEQYVKDAINAIPEKDMSNYALKTEIPDVSSFTTMSAVEAKGYQTETQVNSLINAALGVIENGSY